MTQLLVEQYRFHGISNANSVQWKLRSQWPDEKSPWEDILLGDDTAVGRINTGFMKSTHQQLQENYLNSLHSPEL